MSEVSYYLQLIFVSWLKFSRRGIFGILSFAGHSECRPVGLGIASAIWVSVEVEVFLHGAGILLVNQGEELFLGRGIRWQLSGDRGKRCQSCGSMVIACRRNGCSKERNA